MYLLLDIFTYVLHIITLKCAHLEAIIISNTTFVPGQEKSAGAETEKLLQDEVLQAVPEDATVVSLQISLMRVSAFFNGMPFLSMANAVSTQ